MIQQNLADWAIKEINITKGITQASIRNIIKKCAELQAMDSSSLNDNSQHLL